VLKTSTGVESGAVEITTSPIPVKSQPSLTSSDLKVFSGYALNLLKSKCSNIDQKLIFGLQKYFGEQLAKVDSKDVPGDIKKFRAVLKTITECLARPEHDKAVDMFWENSAEGDGLKTNNNVTVGTTTTTIRSKSTHMTTPKLRSTTQGPKGEEKKVGIFSRIISWFSDIFDSVGNFFKRLFGVDSHTTTTTTTTRRSDDGSFC